MGQMPYGAGSGIFVGRSMGPGKKKRSSVEEQLAAMQALADAPATSELREQLRAALRTAPSLVAARAAKIVRDRAMDGFAEDLEAAFRRFLPDAVKSDPSCRAKLAALEALDFGEHPDPQPFLLATRHFQLEPAWGPPVDTAVGLRARGVLALGRLDYADLPIVAAALLADSESPVRQAVADALAATRQRSYAGLLLLRWNIGDEDPLVIMACMAGVLALAPHQALQHLRSALFGSNPPARDAAALVPAQSGRDDALDLLLAYIEGAPLALDGAVALRALGLHRSDRALDFVLKVIATGEIADAEAVIAGLAARRFEAGPVERAREAAQGKSGARLETAVP